MAAMLLLAIAISIGTHLQAGSSNLEYLSTLIGKVMILGVIQANPGVLYATCMTVMDAGRVAVTELRTLADNQPGGVAQRLIQVLSHSPLQDSQMTQARNRGIMAGLSDRQGVFTQYTNKPGPDLGLLSFYASYLNAYAAAQANQPNAHQYAHSRRRPPIRLTNFALISSALHFNCRRFVQCSRERFWSRKLSDRSDSQLFLDRRQQYGGLHLAGELLSFGNRDSDRPDHPAV